MNNAIMSIEELDRRTQDDKHVQIFEPEKQCRITLAADWPRVVELPWFAGKGSRPTLIELKPGESVVQPISKAQVWFGPFAAPMEYANSVDERHKERVKMFWSQEKERYLSRYDYPRGNGRGEKPDMTPVGPHRSPDVTITIIEPDGEEHQPIRLYQLYKLGDWDPLKDTFVQRESPEELKAKFALELASVSARYEAELKEHRLQMARLEGMVSQALSLAPAKAAK